MKRQSSQNSKQFLIPNTSKTLQGSFSQKEALNEHSIDQNDQIRNQSRQIWKLQQLNSYLYSSIEQREKLIEHERIQSQQKTKVLYKKIEPIKQVIQIRRSTQITRARRSTIFDAKTFSDEIQASFKKQSFRITEPAPEIKQISRTISKTMLGASQTQQSDNFLRLDTEQKIEESKSYIAFEDMFKVSNILDQDLTDEDAIQKYENDGNIKFVSSILQDEERFVKIITQSGSQKLSYIYNKIKKVVADHQNLFMMVLRMKTLQKSAFLITKSMVLDEALQTIVKQTINTLNCESSTCFIADESKGELWSQISQGKNIVSRVPLSYGVAGYVANRKEVVNIQNAYTDVRFNKEDDSRALKKTKTILAAPIMDDNQCLGVLQCVNKKRGFFSREDEILLSMLSEFSQIVLKHTMNNDQQLMAHNKLRKSIQCGIKLQAALPDHDLYTLIKLAESNLKTIMSTDLVRIVIKKDQDVFFYDEKGQYHYINMHTGIINYSINTLKQVSVFNPMQSIHFCPLIDLNTALPSICLPIIDDKIAIGGIMVVNFQGLQSKEQNLQPRVAPIDAEVLDYFAQQLGKALIQFK